MIPFLSYFYVLGAACVAQFYQAGGVVIRADT
jgi:hypothetical protein